MDAAVMPELESLEIQRLENRAEIPGTGALAIAPQQPDTQCKSVQLSTPISALLISPAILPILAVIFGKKCSTFMRRNSRHLPSSETTVASVQCR